MKVIQILPTLAYGDAVGNNTVAIRNNLKKLGYETMIYAQNIDPRYVDAGIVKHISALEPCYPEDVIIYHMSIGCRLNRFISRVPGRKIMIYHNVTPPEFFEGYSPALVANCRKGREDIEYMYNKFDYAIADSDYNRSELVEAGYTCETETVPILIQFEDYAKEPDKDVVKNFSDGRTNIIFTGRVAPNKKQEDVIEAFAHYKKYYDPTARLIIVGGYTGMEEYYNKLQELIARLNVEDVIFTNHIPFNQILAYYHVADLFLCMSEHEGFCVPLVEAMYFDVPIVAYDKCAVGETLGAGGILLNEKNPVETAAVMNKVLKDKELRDIISKNQKARLHDFSREVVEKKLMDRIKRFIADEQ